MTRVAIDAHMVGQAAAGDAGNGRYARSLVAAMAATAEPGDVVGPYRSSVRVASGVATSDTTTSPGSAVAAIAATSERA